MDSDDRVIGYGFDATASKKRRRKGRSAALILGITRRRTRESCASHRPPRRRVPRARGGRSCSCASPNGRARSARWSELGAILTSLVAPIYPPIGQTRTRPIDATRARARRSVRVRPVTFSHDRRNAIASDRSATTLTADVPFHPLFSSPRSIFFTYKHLQAHSRAIRRDATRRTPRYFYIHTYMRRFLYSASMTRISFLAVKSDGISSTMSHILSLSMQILNYIK